MKILLVDDSNYWKKMHTFALKYYLGQNIIIDKANSAKTGVLQVVKNSSKPYDIIFVDMNMEDDFEPLYAGEWFLQQLQTHQSCDHAKVFIVSSITEIEEVAKKYGVNFISKSKCVNNLATYEILLKYKNQGD